MTQPVSAVWTIELNTECPNCKKDVDLLDYGDFWDGRQLKVGENRTENADDQEVKCPECGHEFNVKCEY